MTSRRNGPLIADAAELWVDAADLVVDGARLMELLRTYDVIIAILRESE